MIRYTQKVTCKKTWERLTSLSLSVSSFHNAWYFFVYGSALVSSFLKACIIYGCTGNAPNAMKEAFIRPPTR